MELLTCTQCKGDIQLSEDGLFGRCIFCGATYHFKNEKNTRVISLLNQANVLRCKGDYEGAILAYQFALKEDETDSDAYWGIVLSTYGIEYVEDVNNKLVPTCRRIVKTSILEDENYKNAVKYATEERAEEIVKQANEIDNLQNNIKQKIKYEQDYDVFICFKSNDANNPTRDRFIARQIYDELNKRNIHTFFSEISLKDRLGEDYEAIIYKALYSCKYFILVATNPEYIQAPWVRNEWTRFRDRAREENLENRAFVVFDNIKENELPPLFRKQGIDLSKYPAGGYEVEIADGLSLKIKNHENSNNNYNNIELVEDKISDIMDKKLQGTRETFKERLDRATGYFDIGEKQKAFELLDTIIDMYPRKSDAWWTKVCFLTDNFSSNLINVHTNQKLKEQILYNYENACRFASNQEKDEYALKSLDYFTKLKNLENFDNLLSEYDNETEKLFYIIQEKENLNLPERIVKKREYENLKQVLDFNKEKIENLKNRTSKKSYYINSVPKIKKWFYGFLNFITFGLCITSIVFSSIELGKVIQAKTSVLPTIAGGVLIIGLSLIPAVIAKIDERKQRYKKVKTTIDNDKKTLQSLINENENLQQKLNVANKTIENDEKLCNVNQRLEQQETSIEDLKNNINNLIQDQDIKHYFELLQQDYINNLDKQVIDYSSKIYELEKECDTLRKSTTKKIELSKKNKPKIYNPKYDIQISKNDEYIKENQKYINLVDNEIDKTETQIKLISFKKENNIFKLIKKEN